MIADNLRNGAKFIHWSEIEDRVQNKSDHKLHVLMKTGRNGRTIEAIYLSDGTAAFLDWDTKVIPVEV